MGFSWVTCFCLSNCGLIHGAHPLTQPRNYYNYDFYNYYNYYSYYYYYYNYYYYFYSH